MPLAVRHVAGDVEYDVAQFIAKNSETMEAMTLQLLRAPGLQFLSEVGISTDAEGGAKAEGKSDAWSKETDYF